MRKTLASLTVGAAALGILIGSGLGSASAVTTDQYDAVRYVFCSDNRYGNELTYYDNVGRHEQINVRLDEDNGANRWCGHIDYTEWHEYGWFASSSIVNENSPYTYCAIYVNARLAAASEDYYGNGKESGYSFAFC